MTHEEVTERLIKAVGHEIDGEQDRALRILTDMARTETASMMYGAMCGLAVIAKAAMLALRQQPATPAFWYLQPVNGRSAEELLNTPLLFAARFITAHLNDDTHTALALYLAAYLSEDPDVYPACVQALLAATGAAVKAASQDTR